jgi:hypothetical protein
MLTHRATQAFKHALAEKETQGADEQSFFESLEQEDVVPMTADKSESSLTQIKMQKDEPPSERQLAFLNELESEMKMKRSDQRIKQ